MRQRQSTASCRQLIETGGYSCRRYSRSASGIGCSSWTCCRRRPARSSSGGTYGKSTLSFFAVATAVPAAWPSWIIVRDSRQLDAASELKLAPRQAIRRLLKPLGIRQRYGIPYGSFNSPLAPRVAAVRVHHVVGNADDILMFLAAQPGQKVVLVEHVFTDDTGAFPHTQRRSHPHEPITAKLGVSGLPRKLAQGGKAPLFVHNVCQFGKLVRTLH